MVSFFKYFFIGIAFISLGIGFIGIVIPVLPTTPFFLLSAIIFTRFSKKASDWFVKTKIYNKFVLSIKKHEMTKFAKVKVLITLSIIFVVGIYFSPFYAKIIIGIVALIHFYYFCFKIKTIKSENDVENI